jgi:plasmid replication initiation protein
MENIPKGKTTAFKKQSTTSNLVVSSNDLVHAKYHMTLWQKRLFAFAISQIKREDHEFTWQRIHYAELVNYFEASGGKKAYEAIKEAPKHLDMTIEVPYRDEKGNLRYAFLKVLNGYTTPSDEGTRNQYIELKFNDELRPHLLTLKSRFMGYDLINVKGLRSVYSVRIFELLKSHEFQREVTFEVDYLREILQLKDSYKLYTDFRRNVIEKAQKDMLEKCDIIFEFQEVKSGNKIASLIFTILPNKTRKVETELELSPDTIIKGILPALGESMSEVVNHSSDPEHLVINFWGVNEVVYKNIKKEHTIEEIQQAIRVTQRKISSGEVGNKAGFFVAALQNKFTDEEELKEQKKLKVQDQKVRLAQLDAEMNTISEAFWKKVVSRVRILTESDPIITERAIEALKSNTHPLVRSKIQSLGQDAKIEDFRRDEYLREKVLDEIIKQNPDTFSPLYKILEEEQRYVKAEIEGIRKSFV